MAPKTEYSPNSNQVVINNSGCGIIFLIASMLAGISGFLFSSVPIIICGVIGIIISLIMIANSKVTVDQSKYNELVKKQAIQTASKFNDIDESYFDTIKHYGDRLYQFLQTISHNPSLKEELDKSVHFTSNNSNISSYDLISTLMATDILKVYQQLDYKFKVDKKESFAMIYIIARLHNLENLTYSNLPAFYDRIVKIVFDYMPLLENIINDNANAGVRFIFGALVNNADEEAGKHYNSLLYRYASLVAKADGNITMKESDFLKSIMSPQEKLISESESQKPVRIDSIEEKEGMSQLDELVGLDLVKNDVATLVNFIKIQNMRASKGMKAPSLSYHCVFTGNPGTGKTTVARILASIYKDLGILKKGHLVETDRSGLIAEYVGQTAVKTNKIIDSALDGVLFIDEAYSLVSNSLNDYGKEAIATLLKRMEDNRERLIVILAGYTQEMKAFIDSNPGLQSRFNRYLKFEDYSEEELLKIYLRNLKKFEYSITDEAIEKMKQLINKAVINKDHNFGNARWTRNIFERTLENQANRLATDNNISNEALTTITEHDIPCI